MLPERARIQHVADGVAHEIDGQDQAEERNRGRGEVPPDDWVARELVARLVGLSERIESVAFSPDGKRLAVAGGAPGRRGELQVWRVATRELELSRSVTFDTLRGVSWSDDGTVIAFGCTDDTVRAVDAATGEELLYQGAHEDWVQDTAFSTDGSHLLSVSRDRSLKLIKLETQQFIDNVTSITPGVLKGGLIALERHPERDEVLVGGADGTPRVFRVYREKKREIGDDYNLIRALEPLPGRVFAVAWMPDGERTVAGASLHGSGEVRAYGADGAPLWSHPTPGAVYTVAVHPSGERVAAAGFDGRVRLLDASTGELVHEFIPVPWSPTEEPEAKPAKRVRVVSVGGPPRRAQDPAGETL